MRDMQAVGVGMSSSTVQTIAERFKRKPRIEKRSPIKDAPLRYAGQSVEEEIQKMLNDKVAEHAAVMGMLALLALWEWYHWYFNPKPHPIVMTIFSLTGTAYFYVKVIGYRKQIRLLRQARDGEKAVGQYLEGLREIGHKIFHDVLGEGFNVDHVIVGPVGVYSVETKTISKPEKGTPQVVYDGESITVDGFKPDRDPIVQAKAQASWLHRLIEESTGRDVKVRPVVLYPGWFINRQPRGAEVWVLEPKALPKFLEHERTALTAEDVKLIAYHLSRYVRGKGKTN
jgi:hypothetical protein